MNMFLKLIKLSKFNTMKDYHDLHLKVNVFLFDSVFKDFRKESVISLKLGPSNFSSTAAYSWHSMLKFTDLI